jgi:hypothetical protein
MNLRTLWLIVCSLAVAAGLAAKAGVEITGGSGLGSNGTTVVTTVIPDAVNTLTVSNTLQVNGQLVGQPLVLTTFKGQLEHFFDAATTNVEVLVFGDSITPAALLAAHGQAALGYGGPGTVSLDRNAFASSSGHQFVLVTGATGWATNDATENAVAWGPTGGSLVGGTNATLTFHFGEPRYLADRVRVWFEGSATGGTFQVITPSASVTNTVNTSLYSGLASYTIDLPLAVHTNTLTVTSGTVRLYAVGAVSRALGGPVFSLFGRGGTHARQWVQYGQSLSNYAATVGAPLVLCTLGYNDTSATQAVTDIATMRSWFPAADFAAVYPYGASNTTVQSKINAIISGLRAAGVQVIDQSDVFPSSLMLTNSWLPDGLHPNARGAESTALELVARVRTAIGRHWDWFQPVPKGENGIASPVNLVHSGRIFGGFDPLYYRMVIGPGGVGQGNSFAGPYDAHPGYRVSSSGSGIYWIYNPSHNGGVALHNGALRVGTGGNTPMTFGVANFAYGTLSAAGVWTWGGTTTNTGTTTFTQPITAPRVAVNAATNFITTVDGTNLVWVTGTITQRVTLGTYP